MSLIPEVKCRRCGERFSSLRSRCPNCGTRRVAQSSRTPGATPGTVSGTAAYERAGSNTRWQMLFGLILVVAVVLAVIVMVTTSLNSTDPSIKKTPVAPAPTVAPEQPSAEPVPTPTPTPPPTVEVLQIRYNDDERTEFTMSPGEIVPINAYVSPLTITDKVKWSSDDPDEEYFIITVDPDDGNKINIECLKYSDHGINFYAEIFGKKAECMIHFRRA